MLSETSDSTTGIGDTITNGLEVIAIFVICVKVLMNIDAV
jgi:hypothetical protein